jgi:hypothetical protein
MFCSILGCSNTINPWSWRNVLECTEIISTVHTRYIKLWCIPATVIPKALEYNLSSPFRVFKLASINFNIVILSKPKPIHCLKLWSPPDLFDSDGPCQFDADGIKKQGSRQISQSPIDLNLIDHFRWLIWFTGFVWERTVVNWVGTFWFCYYFGYSLCVDWWIHGFRKELHMGYYGWMMDFVKYGHSCCTYCHMVRAYRHKL